MMEVMISIMIDDDIIQFNSVELSAGLTVRLNSASAQMHANKTNDNSDDDDDDDDDDNNNNNNNNNNFDVHRSVHRNIFL